MRRLFGLTILTTLLLLGQHTACAAPVLQLYLEGGGYDEASGTWVLTPAGSSSGAPFRLWVIGNVDGPEGQGTVKDARLAVAYSGDHLGLVILLTPSQIDRDHFTDFVDPSVPIVPTLNTTVQTSLGMITTGPDGVVTNGSAPMLADGSSLPAHEVYGAGTVWQEYSLGDLVLTDSPVGDFAGSFPAFLSPDAGQINVYEVSVIGGSGARVHLDLCGAVDDAEGASAVFFDDADAEVIVAPEPATLIVWLLIGLTWAGSAWRYQYWHRWQRWEEQGADAAAAVDDSLPTGPSAGRAADLEEQPGTQAGGHATVPGTGHSG